MQHLRHWKKLIICILFISVIFLFASPTDAQDYGWNIKKSKHFVIYYKGDIFPEYIGRIIKEAEDYYDSITDYLGFKRFNYWTWDNRCKLYLFKDPEEYNKHVGTVAWSRGHVNVIKKEISTYLWQEEFFDIILPHEMAHIIFREFIGFDKKLPLWLDEGVACSQERGNEERLLIAKFMIKLKLYTPFEELSNVNTPELIMPFLFYSQAASILDFLLQEFGRERFVNFCRRLRDETDWQESLLSVYNAGNLKELEDKWGYYLSKDLQ